MNDNIKIDSNKLNEYIIKLKEDNEKIRQVFENINNIIANMPNYWQSDTSACTLSVFDNFHKDFDNIYARNNKYISFLESIVIDDYSEKDDNLNKIIDNNI